MKVASIVLIVLGLVSLGVSAVWTKIAPKPAAMSAEQEEKYMQVVGDMHNAPSKEMAAESKALLEEVERSSAKAQSIEHLGTTVFRYGGIALALVGAGLFFWVNSTEG